MKKTTIIAAIVVLLVFLFRFVQVTVSSVGDGTHIFSPDQRFEAEAISWRTTRFFGGRHIYYEFKIYDWKVEPSHRRCIQHVVMDEPPQGMVGVRDADLIQWAADSSSVTYTFKGTKLILSVIP